MITLAPNEKMLIVVHKHWFVLFLPVCTLLFLTILPTFAVTGLKLIPLSISHETLIPLTNFGLSLYILILLLLAFITWIDYYFDMWIITDKRIIDISQSGIFSREVSEIPLGQIQDVTVDINGIVRTFLKFGTIRIQTAGERDFSIEDIPDLYEIKNLILQYKILSSR